MWVVSSSPLLKRWKHLFPSLVSTNWTKSNYRCEIILTLEAADCGGNDNHCQKKHNVISSKHWFVHVAQGKTHSVTFNLHEGGHGGPCAITCWHVYRWCDCTSLPSSEIFITVMQNRTTYGGAVDSIVASQQEYPLPGILEVLHSICFPPQFGDIHARLMGDSKSLF